ncbi:MAG: DUF4399 domain-containing protein [Methanospirillum sp.]
MADFLRAGAVVMLVVMTAGVLLSGCTTTPSTAGTPTIAISSPQNGEAVPAGNVTVTVRVTNFSIVDKQGQASVAGQGHLHFYMDVTPPSDPSKPAIPTDPNAAWAHVSGTTYTFTNVTPGSHTISVQLVNNDHTPISPITTASVTVTVSGPAATPSVMIVSPQNGATVSAGNVTVTAMVSNFTVVDKQGQNSVAGQGHLHFYMDVSPLPSTPGQPAIPTDPNAAWVHVSGTTYTFTNVTAGQHTFAVQLANNDHTPVIPIVTDSVTVTATGSSATTQPATTGAATTSTTIATTTTTSSSGGSSGY